MEWNQLIKACSTETCVQISQDENFLIHASSDFGHLVQNTCHAVALPKNIKEVESLIQFANKHHISLTPRGYGLSQSGQAIPSNNAISLDLRDMQQDIDVDIINQTVRCPGHISW